MIQLAEERDEFQRQYNDLLHTGNEPVTKNSWFFQNSSKDRTIQDLRNQLESMTKAHAEFNDKYNKKKHEVSKLQKQLEELETEKDNINKSFEAKVRELGDESQQLRNTLAFSAGDHQSWILDSIVGELAQVKNKVKAVLFRLQSPSERRLDWLGIFSTITFSIAVNLMGRHINDIMTHLGYLNNEGSNPNRNSLASRTKLFIKSVLQINFGSIDLLTEFVPLLKEELEKMTGQPHDNVLAELALLGVDDSVIKSLATFALKLQLLEPPVSHRFEPYGGFPEECLLGALLNGKRQYLFPAIDQWSNKHDLWLITQVQLTYID